MNKKVDRFPLMYPHIANSMHPTIVKLGWKVIVAYDQVLSPSGEPLFSLYGITVTFMENGIGDTSSSSGRGCLPSLHANALEKDINQYIPTLAKYKFLGG